MVRARRHGRLVFGESLLLFLSAAHKVAPPPRPSFSHHGPSSPPRTARLWRILVVVSLRRSQGCSAASTFFLTSWSELAATDGSSLANPCCCFSPPLTRLLRRLDLLSHIMVRARRHGRLVFGESLLLFLS